jgi:hypothetical protein
VFRYQKRFAATPEQVWESLTSDISIAAWGPAIKEVNWTSPRPFGVGTTREVVAPGGSTMRERCFRWDEGSSHAFYVYESKLPIFKRFAEDYVVEPDGAENVVHVDGRDRAEERFQAPAQGAGAHTQGRLWADTQRRAALLRQRRVSFRDPRPHYCRAMAMRKRSSGSM